MLEKLSFKRGLILSSLSEYELNQKIGGRYFDNIKNGWIKSHFGPYTLWCDPLLKPGRRTDSSHQVAIFGLAVNPFDGAADNETIAENLFSALKESEAAFQNYVDSLTGSFLVLHRVGVDVFLQQDAAATKTIYYHRSSDNTITAAVHPSIVAKLHGLTPSARAAETWTNDEYRKDASRHLPGLVTPYNDLLPLTANTRLQLPTGRVERIFPRSPNVVKMSEKRLVTEISRLMCEQARLVAGMNRPIRLAATGGRDSRLSLATFVGQPNVELFTFYRKSTGHLAKDVAVAKKLARMTNLPLNVYNLDKEEQDYNDFKTVFDVHMPNGIWPNAAYTYVKNFPEDSIHVRSTVSEIGRVFYTTRKQMPVTADLYVKVYTPTPFNQVPWVAEEISRFFELTQFSADSFHGYSPADMFYWEHRNSKWQNVLCVEAEMAGDVFIPYNNRRILQMFLSAPYDDRLASKIHFAIIKKLRPDFSAVEIV